MPGNVTSSSVTTSVSTSTLTLTGSTHTVTVQAAPVLLFGLPPELVLIFTLAIVGIVFLFLRFNVKGVPVQLVWIYKNGSALMLKVQEDLQGIFLTVIKGGKKIETLKKTGLALPVTYIPGKFEAYIESPAANKNLENAINRLRSDGFKVLEQPDRKKGFFPRPTLIKAYIIQKEPGVEKALAYLAVNLGGLKTARLYASIEGSGETINWQPRIDQAPQTDPGNTILLQEMKSAAKSFFALLAEAMQGSFRNYVLPLIAGAGIGGISIFLIVELTGHLH